MAQQNPVYDKDSDDKPTHHSLPSEDRPQAAGKPSDPRSTYDPQKTPKADSSDPRSELNQAEQAAGSGQSSDGQKSELMAPSGQSTSGEEGGLYNNEGSGSSKKSSRFSARTKRRAGIGGGIAGIGIFGAIIFGSVAQGPLQFIHFAQLLQRFHFSSHEAFQDYRSSKMLYYGITGQGGTQDSRLGTMGNKFADKWEEELVKKTGLRPVYSQRGGRFIGFEIVDENKAVNNLLDASEKDGKAARGVERAMGKGAEIKTVGEARAGKQAIVGVNGKLSDKTKIIDVRGVKSYRERARFIKTIGESTHSSKIAGAIGSRLLIKRGGVDFHPLKNAARKKGESLADWYSRVREDMAKRNETGTTETKLGNNDKTDKNGKPVASSETQAATSEAQAAGEEAASSTGRETIKNIVKKLGKGGAAIGVLCAAKSIGNNVEDYKYVNNALPMMRMGMSVVTMGNQVMSTKDVNNDELSAYSTAFYDKKTSTSWTDAKSIQAELGQDQKGPDTPPEARLNNVGDKPAFFDLLDSIGPLNAACGISDTISGLPIINEVSGAISDAVVGALNAAAGTFGTSVDQLMQGALAAISGKSVNTLASGAEFGNLANTGAFLSANDTAASTGGAPMSPSDVAILKTETDDQVKQDNSTKTFAQRYLDPYNRDTLVASAIDAMPNSGSGFAAALSNFGSLFSGSFFKTFGALFPKAHAATSGYDYGVPKFGFTANERDDPEFENPYDNAKVLESDPNTISELNDKYGRPCYGMTVTVGSDGVTIDSEAMGSDDLNVFKVVKKPECDPKQNPDPMFLRYRMYLSDAVTANSLACYYGDDTVCASLGFGNSTQNSGVSSGTEVSGDAQQLAQQIIDAGNVSGDPRYMAQIQAVAKGDFSCNINPSILKMLVGVTVLDKHKISVSSLNRRCTGVLTASGTGSFHYKDGGGHAIDVVGFDGGTVDGNGDKATLGYLNEAVKFLPKNTGFGQVGSCGSGFKIPSGDYTVPDSCNHQHIQVPVERINK